MEGNLLTPGDVRDVTFDVHGIFRKNYDADQVDEFLERVRTTLDVLGAEVVRLQGERI